MDEHLTPEKRKKMDVHLSPQTLEALADVISGGSANTNVLPVGIYRSGPKLETFMHGCGVEFSVGNSSRVPALIEKLEELNNGNSSNTLKRIIELAADPRDFIGDDDKWDNVIRYLNDRLVFDGLSLLKGRRGVRLVEEAPSASVTGTLSETAAKIDFDTVEHDLQRALSSADLDPEDAVTSACSILESVCRSILAELELPLPEKKDIQSLYKAVREPLGLTPQKTGVREEIYDDVRAILGGLNSTIQGIGALRTHGGDAHGRERGRIRMVDARIARLAIHSASAAALFLIETWQKKFPNRTLKTQPQEKW